MAKNPYASVTDKPSKLISITTSGGGGGVTGVIPVGTETDSLAFVSGVLAAQPVGTNTESFAFTDSTAVSVGSDTDTLAAANSVGSSTLSEGTESGAWALASSELAAQSVGSDTDAFAASVSALAINRTSGASSSGTPGFTNPGNANGGANGTVATITASAGVGGASGNGTLTCPSVATGTSPGAGFTRSTVALTIVQQIDTTVTLSTCSCIINASKSDGTSSFEVYRSTEATNTRNDGSLIADTYTITSNVSAWTDNEVRDMRITCVAAYNLTAAVGGNFTWSIDNAARRITWTKASLP